MGWHEACFHGRWVNGVNAGGSGVFAGKKGERNMGFFNVVYLK